MAGQHHGLNGHECEQTPGDGEGQGSLVCCRSWGHKESDTQDLATEQQQQRLVELDGVQGDSGLNPIRQKLYVPIQVFFIVFISAKQPTKQAIAFKGRNVNILQHKIDLAHFRQDHQVSAFLKKFFLILVLYLKKVLTCQDKIKKVEMLYQQLVLFLSLLLLAKHVK